MNLDSWLTIMTILFLLALVGYGVSAFDGFRHRREQAKKCMVFWCTNPHLRGDVHCLRHMVIRLKIEAEQKSRMRK